VNYRVQKGASSHFIAKIGIGNIIDRALPKTRHHKASHSAIIKTMSLNGLGFNESRLYFYSNFFIGLSTESLLGEGISPSNLNDDTLSRILDAIYDYGPTELFNELALQVMNKMAEETHLLHVDTTTSRCLESMRAVLLDGDMGPGGLGPRIHAKARSREVPMKEGQL
jgi:transposase